MLYSDMRMFASVANCCRMALVDSDDEAVA